MLGTVDKDQPYISCYKSQYYRHSSKGCECISFVDESVVLMKLNVPLAILEESLTMRFHLLKASLFSIMFTAHGLCTSHSAENLPLKLVVCLPLL